MEIKNILELLREGKPLEEIYQVLLKEEKSEVQKLEELEIEEFLEIKQNRGTAE